MGKINILITGDFCPHNRIEKLALKSNFNAIFNDFLDVFEGNDLNVTDLECPLTLSKKKRPKTGPHQKAHPKCIEILKYANFGLVTLANNHIMDFGHDGVRETIDLCNEVGISTVGVGMNTNKDKQDYYRKPYILDKNGKRIAILNISDNEFLTSPDSDLKANPIHPINNFYDIQKARIENDFVILIVHGGNEFYPLPSPRVKQLYRFFIDAGADAVVSHHTHRFSGYEIYNQKPIFYGLGNFIYDWPGKINTGWNRGYVVKLILSDTIDFKIIPLKQCNEIPGIFHLNDQEKKVFQNELLSLNSIIADEQRLEKDFRSYCKSVHPMYDAFIEPYFGKFITALRKRGLFPKLMSRRKRLLLLNIIRCESHREVLMNLLYYYDKEE